MATTATRKLTGTFCGEFYTNENTRNKDCRYVGDIWKLAAGRFVIRRVEYGAIIWESAEFTGKEFKKLGTADYGCGQRVNQYTSK